MAVYGQDVLSPPDVVTHACSDCGVQSDRGGDALVLNPKKAAAIADCEAQCQLGCYALGLFCECAGVKVKKDEFGRSICSSYSCKGDCVTPVDWPIVQGW